MRMPPVSGVTWSMRSSTGTALPWAVTVPVSRKPSPSRRKASEQKVMSGYAATSRNEADRTSVSRLALFDRKLPASTVTATLEAVTGSATRSSPELIAKVACTTPRPNM